MPRDVFLVILQYAFARNYLHPFFVQCLKALLSLHLQAQQAITEIERMLEAQGLIRAVNISTILQCVVVILGVNHVLACLTFYVGRQEQTVQGVNWIDTHHITDMNWTFQYMCLG